MGSILRHPVYVSRDGLGLLRELAARGFALLAAGTGGVALHEVDFVGRRDGSGGRAGAGSGGESTADPGAGLPRPPVAVLIGSEATGLAPELLALVREVVSIPMAGPTESLNAAVAGSVVHRQLCL